MKNILNLWDILIEINGIECYDEGLIIELFV